MSNAIRRIKDVRLWPKFGVGFKSPNYISFAVRKKNGLIEFQDFISYQSRNSSIQSLIGAADEKFDLSDFDWVIVNAGDVYAGKEHKGFPVLSVVVGEDDYEIACPDFVYHSWAETGLSDYDAVTTQLRYTPLPKSKYLGWRGNNNHPKRDELVKICRNMRDVDVDFVRWIEDGKNGYLKELSVNFLSYEEQVNRWRYFVDVEGTGYSGRLKFLLATHRIVLLIDRKHKEWFFKHLEPWTHYVPIEADMSDLADKLNYVRNNEGAERKILRFLPEFSDKFLSRRAAINRWARLLKGL